MTIKITTARLLIPLLTLPMLSQAQAEESWEFEVTPYLWAAGMSGSTGPEDLVADIDMSFSDVLENLDGGFILHMQATKGQWNTWFDYVRLDIAADGEVLIFDIDMGMSQTLAEAGVAYQLQATGPISLIGGLRYMNVDTNIKFKVPPIDGRRKVSFGDDWVDPFIGLRGNWEINDKWSIGARGDVGGFGVGSDLTWAAQAAAKYQFGEKWSFKFGYRHMDFDYDDNGFVFDMAESGLLIGAGYQF